MDEAGLSIHMVYSSSGRSPSLRLGRRREKAPNLRLSRGERCDPVPDSDQEPVLEHPGEPQQDPPGMGDDLPDGVEEQEPEPLRPGGPEISG